MFQPFMRNSIQARMKTFVLCSTYNEAAIVAPAVFFFFGAWKLKNVTFKKDKLHATFSRGFKTLAATLWDGRDHFRLISEPVMYVKAGLDGRFHTVHSPLSLAISGKNQPPPLLLFAISTGAEMNIFANAMFVMSQKAPLLIRETWITWDL